MGSGAPIRALFVDLNSFARYPTLGVGYLVAVLREAGVEVEVMTPLSLGMPAIVRERPETWRDDWERRLTWSERPWIRSARQVLGRWRERRRVRDSRGLAAEARRVLDSGRHDVLLVSSYLDQFALCAELGAAARDRGIPFLLGGSYFFQPEVARAWLDLPGLTALVGAEAERCIADLVEEALAGGELLRHPGVFLPDGRGSDPAAPLLDLDRLPFPDFSDFPWERYPNRMIPVMTGRGCGWGACTFCSDVVSTNGRSFRSRPVAQVLDEMVTQSRRHGSRDFVILDLKLNSDLRVWRGLIEQLPARLPGARWVCAVHVDTRADNGLGIDELRAARAAGLVRVTTGIESGSQRMLDQMDKGTTLSCLSRFLHDAAAVGLSVRATVVDGIPEESPEEIQETARFLHDHRDCLERIRINHLHLVTGSRIERAIARQHEGALRLRGAGVDPRRAYGELQLEDSRARRVAVRQLLSIVHEVNAVELRESAREFDGTM